MQANIAAIAALKAFMPTNDLRGAARLATDATAGLTNLVEAMHERIARLPGVKAPADAGRTSGITGLVYKTIRGVTHLVGGSLDALLAMLAPTLDPKLGTDTRPGLARPERDAVVAALNGVLGDYLAATANPLACSMGLRHDGKPLTLQRDALAAALPQASGTLFVLVHGLCMNDVQWRRNGHDHGAALAAECGGSAIYLRYNSGLHISINGRQLAQQLQALCDAWPQALQRVVLIGHSMGGLVLRSAFHHAEQAGLQWPQQVVDLVFLGTPHHGAPLERAGQWVDTLLGATPYASPFARLGKVRSAGITDLRHGNLLDEDWLGRDRFAHRADRRLPVPLPSGPRCWAIAASLGAEPGAVKDRLWGDGLVPVDSALGRHAQAARTLAFAPERQWLAQGVSHLDLMSNADVYGQLRTWLLQPR
jgi:pimeloyl-ACP methyl ester carboxylesterase